MPQRAKTVLAGAGVSAGLLVLTWLAVFHIGPVQRADVSILRGFADLGQHPHVSSLAQFIAHLCNPKPWVYFAAVPVLIAVARRRLWVALAIVAILLGANVTTQLLKPLLATHRPSVIAGTGPAGATWPSGHATAAMSLALCLVLAVPARLRAWMAALGAAFAIAVCYSFLALLWHYPSDVLGGFLVAVTWTLLGVAAVLFAQSRHAGRTPSGLEDRISVREALGPPAIAALAALVLALLVAIARPQAVAYYARLHEAFVIGAAAIAVLGLSLATAVMLTLRR